MESDRDQLRSLYVQIVNGLSERNRIEMGKRREPGDTRKLEDAKTITEDGLNKLKAFINQMEG